MALSKHWLNYIGGWQHGGLSQAAYCQKHGLNTNSFTGYLGEFRKHENLAPAELIPVQVKEELSVTHHVLLFTVQDCRLELPATVSAQWLAELLRCLR